MFGKRRLDGSSIRLLPKIYRYKYKARLVRGNGMAGGGRESGGSHSRSVEKQNMFSSPPAAVVAFPVQSQMQNAC